MEHIGKIRRKISEAAARVVITGDSLSYNRYGFDNIARANAYDCYPGMPSWSFRLRDEIWRNDAYFCYGSELAVDTGPVSEVADHLYAMLHGGRARTWIVKDSGTVVFAVRTGGPGGVLRMQKRPEGSCIFDVYVDDILCEKDVDNQGEPTSFQGWAPFEIAFDGVRDTGNHIISFRNIRMRREEAHITVTSVGALRREVFLTGRGSTQTSFFVEHFMERIGRYAPDLLIITSGANYRDTPMEEYQRDVWRLFELVYAQNPDCGILAISLPDCHDPNAPDSDESPYLSRKTCDTRRRVLEEACKKYRCCFFDLMAFFDGVPLEQWRFDNIHLTRQGNDMLFHRLHDLLF